MVKVSIGGVSPNESAAQRWVAYATQQEIRRVNRRLRTVNCCHPSRIIDLAEHKDSRGVGRSIDNQSVVLPHWDLILPLVRQYFP